MLTVAAEFKSREEKDKYIDELRQWCTSRNINIGESLLGVVFTQKDLDAVNTAEQLLFSRKFPGLNCFMRPTHGKG